VKFLAVDSEYPYWGFW